MAFPSPRSTGEKDPLEPLSEYVMFLIIAKICSIIHRHLIANCRSDFPFMIQPCFPVIEWTIYIPT